MNITFHGAAREVTGSMHLLDNGNDRILLDCGLFQGRRKESAEKNRVIPFDPGIITNVVLSHAHIDHSGRIPLLGKKNYSGSIYCTRATSDACHHLLKDSAKIQESDASYLNYKLVKSSLAELKNSALGGKLSNREMKNLKKMMKRGRNQIDEESVTKVMQRFHLERIHPLYTTTDAEEALTLFRGQPYRRPATVGQDISCTFYDAGHIIGSAISVIKAKGPRGRKTVCFTGDLGRFTTPIIKDPTLTFADQDREIDLLLMESTYGDRLHQPVEDLKPGLRKILKETRERGGCVIIPSFAFGRTQELLYFLHEIYDEGGIDPMPVYVDSPLAVNLTRVYGEHPEVYDREASENFLGKGKNPFEMKLINYVGSVEESMALNRDQRPHVVLSASGMCEAGRILHHLRFKMHNEKNTILIVGYMAANTLGRRLQDQGLDYEEAGRHGEAPIMKIFNKEYPLKARVKKMGGFSAHADRDEMLRFLKQSNLRIKKIAVIHGEEDQSLAFAGHLREAGFDAFVPKSGETLRI